MSTTAGEIGTIRQVCATLLGVRHVRERLCRGPDTEASQGASVFSMMMMMMMMIK